MKKEAIIKFYSDFKLYIFPAVVSLSSLFLIVFAIYPQTAKLITDQKSTDSIISKSKILETKVNALEGFDEEDLSQKVGFALASLPAEKDFGNAFELLQRVITGSGFSVTSITLSNSSNKKSKADSYEMRLEVKGTRSIFPVLLSNLENSQRLVRVSSIDVMSRLSSPDLDASLVVEVLYSQAPQDFGSIDSPLPKLSQEDEALLVKLGVGRQVSGSTQAPQLPSSPRGKSNPFE